MRISVSIVSLTKAMTSAARIQGGTQTRRHVGRTEVGRLSHGQGPDIALQGRIKCGGHLCRHELVADLAGEIGAIGLP